jgi:hypothetical protein
LRGSGVVPAPSVFDLNYHKCLRSLTLGDYIEPAVLPGIFEALRTNDVLENMELQIEFRSLFSALQQNQCVSRLVVHMPRWVTPEYFDILTDYFLANTGKLKSVWVHCRENLLENWRPYFESLDINHYLRNLIFHWLEVPGDMKTEAIVNLLKVNPKLICVQLYDFVVDLDDYRPANRKSFQVEGGIITANRKQFLADSRKALIKKIKQRSLNTVCFRKYFHSLA